MKYRIVTGEIDDSVIELRLTIVNGDPTVEGRNPNGEWHNILWFSGNTPGSLFLSKNTTFIKGLDTDKEGKIKLV